MTPVLFEKDGIQIKVTGVVRNKVFVCNRCSSFEAERCALKKKLGITFNDKELHATEITVIVTNISNRAFSIKSGFWEVVDSEGFSYGCMAPCDSHMAPRMVNADHWDVTPGTQVKFVLLFPELEDKINVVSLLYSGMGVMARLDVRKPTKKVEALLLARENFQKAHAAINRNKI